MFVAFADCFLGADVLQHEEAVAASTQGLSAKGPTGVEKDTVCAPELKGAAQSLNYLQV